MSCGHNLHLYFAAFDGTPKEFYKVKHLFDGVFDDEFLQVDEDTISRDELKQMHSTYLALGSRVEILRCKEVTTSSIEYIDFKFRLTNDFPMQTKLSLTTNNTTVKAINMTVHMIGTLKNGKIVRAKMATQDSRQALLKARHISAFYHVEMKLMALLNIFDGSVKSYSQMKKPFGDLIHNDFVSTLHGNPIRKETMKDMLIFLAEAGTKSELVHFKSLGETQFEIKIRHVVDESVVVTTHSKGTIDKNNMFIKLEPMNTEHITSIDLSEYPKPWIWGLNAHGGWEST